jgi:hypothetical protein
MIRALIPHLESSREAQDIMDKMIKILENLDLMMIALPIKMNFPDLFPNCPDPYVILAQVTDFHLCTALLHYSTMIQRASRDVLNSIFELSIMIASRVLNENNRAALSKIYQHALRSIPNCPQAIKFIQMVSSTEPRVATMEVIRVQEWDRTLGDVTRCVKRLIPSDEVLPRIMISDCHSYQNVVGFLFLDVKTAILPFAAQSEMLEGMSRVARDHQPHKSLPKTLPQFEMPYKSQGAFVREGSYEDVSFGGYRGLQHPKQLMNAPSVFAPKELPALPCTRGEFIAAVLS